MINNFFAEVRERAINDVLSAQDVGFPVPLDCDFIIDCVARAYSLNRQDLLGARGTRHMCDVRGLAMYLCRTLIHASYPEIAKAFDRHHTTIMHVYQVVKAQVDREPDYALKVSALSHICQRVHDLVLHAKSTANGALVETRHVA